MKTLNNKDLSYAMTPLKILTWPLGTWPLQTNNAFSYIRFYFAICILILLAVILNWEIYLDSSDAETNLDVLMISGCVVLAIAKMASFRIYSAELSLNFTSATKDYIELDTDEKRKIMRQHAFMARLTFLGLVFPSYFGSSIFTFLPMLVEDEAEINVTMTDANTVQYPVHSEHVMAILDLPSWMYLLVCFTQSMMLITTSAGNLGSDVFFLGIVLHVCGQTKLLNLEFNRMVGEHGTATEKFYPSINRHRYLLDLVEKLNNTINVVLLIQISFNSVLMCTCGFQFILALDGKNIVLVVKTFTVLIVIMIQMYAYCYVGNYLKLQMDDVGTSLYSCGWYNLPKQVRKDITFVIMKTQRPVQLTAGKIFVINLESYMSMVKTSMSYLSVLRVMISG